MKKLLLPFIGIIFILATAYKPAQRTLLVKSTDPVTREYRDFDDEAYLCNGEIVYLHGTMVLTRINAPAGKNQTSRFRLEFMDVTGISETGVRYKMLGQETLLLRTYWWGETFAMSGIRSMRFIAQGSGMELMITDLHHIVVFADGSFNFVVDSRFIHCNTEHLIIRQNY